MEYFVFEQDFVEDGIRCIPMVVRLKLDTVGIKLKLSQWGRFGAVARAKLSSMSCDTDLDRLNYRRYLCELIARTTGEEAKALPVEEYPAWMDHHAVPGMVSDKAAEFGWLVEGGRWRGLTVLQRFALIKLCRPGHENRNFSKAMVEFGLASPDRPGC